MAGRQDKFQQSMNQGHSAAWDQLWDRAAAFYRQALEEIPDSPQALANLGLALIELQEYDQALDAYKNAAKVSPDDPLPLEKAAQLFERMGNLDAASRASLRAAELYLKKRDASKAIESWQSVTRVKPENVQAHSRLALVYERLGEKDKSVKAYLAVASLLQSEGDMEKAVSAVNRAIQVKPDSIDAVDALKLLKDFKPLPKPARPRGGTAPLRMSQVRQLEAITENTPTEGRLNPVAQARQKALTVLASMLFESSDDGGGSPNRHGLKEIVMGAGLVNKPADRTRMMLHLSQVVDLQTQGNHAEAVEELERAMEFGLEHPAAYFDLGFLYAQVGRLESAIRQLRSSVNHLDFALGSHLLIGELLEQKADPKGAAVEYLQALKWADASVVTEDQADDISQLYEPLVEALRQQDDQQVYEKLIGNVKDLLLRSDWRAQMLRARDQLPNRESGGPPMPLAEILTEARSGDMIDAISIIHDLAGQGKLRSAMEEAFYAIELAPTYLPLHTYMGEMLVDQGDVKGAVTKFQTVARSYTARGEFSLSTNIYRKITAIEPMNLNARGRLIDQLITTGNTEEAIREYLQLADMYYSLADLNMSRKTLAEALRAAQKAQADRESRVRILHQMADIDLQSLDLRQALRVFEQICTLQPNDETARFNLVELNLRLGQEDQAIVEMDKYLSYLTDHKMENQALEFIEKLADEYPKRASIRRRLADLYQHLGRNEEAIGQLDALGDLLMASDDRPGAIQTIKEILTLNPPNKVDYQFLLQQIRSRE